MADQASNNGNGGEGEKPPVVQSIEWIYNTLVGDENLAMTLGANLAWVAKHPEVDFAKTKGQLDKRVDYLFSLDDEEQQQIGLRIAQVCIVIAQHLGQSITVKGPEEPGAKIWIPPAPKVEGMA